MEKHRTLFADLATFGVIAAGAALFGFSHINSDVTVIGRGVFAVALVWAGLSLTVNRPSSS